MLASEEALILLPLAGRGGGRAGGVCGARLRFPKEKVL